MPTSALVVETSVPRLLVERFAAAASSHTSCTVLESDGGEVLTNAALWNRAQQYRSTFRSYGVVRGDKVMIGVPTSMDLLAMILAAWADGAAIALVHADVAERSGKLAPAKLAKMVELVNPALIVFDDAAALHVPPAFHARIMLSAQCIAQAQQAVPVGDVPLVGPDDLAILQFTSGSTGIPKAAVITQAMLSANCGAIAERVQVGSGDRMVSWLPMHHDMGLSAATLAWWGGFDLVMLPTAMFVRQPLSWLEAISKHKATLSPAPASAYALLARFAGQAASRGLDLSSWRYAWSGAEPVFHKHMQAFFDAFAPCGVRRDLIQPAYGMAESVVATSLNTPGLPYRTMWVDAEALYSSGRVELRMPHSAGAVAYVANGKPVRGIEIEIRDVQGTRVAQGASGTVHIRGNSVIQRYLGIDDVCDVGGWYHTGDIGYVHEGDVFISGRAKDVITRAGLNVSPQELEWVAEEAMELKEGSVAAFSYTDPVLAQERVVLVVAKRPDHSTADAIRRELAIAVATKTGIQVDEIVFVKRSTLPKTTSGKIQRAALREARLRGEMHSLI